MPFTMRRLCLLPASVLALSLAPVASAAAAGAPAASTGSPQSITSTSAVGAGSVASNHRPTTFFFRYGHTRAYGQVSAVGGTSAGPGSVSVRESLLGLNPQTSYHVQLVAENASGTSFGRDRTFTTKPTPNALVLGTRPNPTVYGGGVVIAGVLTGNGAAGAPVQLQQNPFPYTGGFQPIGNVQLATASGQFSFALAAPGFNTQYRVVAKGKVNTATAIATVDVAAHVQTFSVHRPHGRHRTVLILGSILPAHPGSPALLERLLSGGRYQVVAVSSLRGGAAGGRPSDLAVRARVRRGGRYRIEVLIADGSNLPAVSHTFRLRAR